MTYNDMGAELVQPVWVFETIHPNAVLNWTGDIAIVCVCVAGLVALWQIVRALRDLQTELQNLIQTLRN